MKKKLEITLKSDLCVASGYSYAGLVDSDVCYDKLGLPYIPARRLKGCFRDTCENVLYNLIDAKKIQCLFGERGSNISGALRISNAKLQNYEEIKDELKTIKEKEDGYLFSQQNVLEQYTHIVAQTAIGEDSAAEDKSLRYTRVVNHYIQTCDVSDACFKETIFEAIIEYNEEILDQDTLEVIVGATKYNTLELIVGATKHIGLKRNRGFGVVLCKIVDFESESKPNVENNVTGGYADDEEYVITYILTNDEPLMLSQLSDVHSEKYISGQSILGNLAGNFLRLPGKTAESTEFNDLFLNGITKYVNAYPATMESKEKVFVYYPAPFNINRLKKTKNYVDTFYPIQGEYNQPGNQPKKLKGKYLYQNISENDIEIDIKDVNMKLHYHHRRGEDSILYPLEAIEPNQVFAGEIHTKGKYVDFIKKLIDNKDFYFGKSKTAQYGHCLSEIIDVKPVGFKKEKGKRILVTLLTDAIFCDDSDYTVEAETVAKQIWESISLPQVKCQKIMMETGLISGYQTTWNMHKPLYPIVKAGSCFVFECEEEVMLPDRIWVGTKNQEGYGYASIVSMKERYIKEIEKKYEKCSDKQVTKFNPQYCNILKKKLIEELCAESFKLKGISKTQISRAILMVKQSTDFKDFKARINSIKTESTKNAFNNRLVKPMDGGDKADIGKLIHNRKDAEKYYQLLIDKKADLSDLWRDYLLYNLTLCKYEAKEN